MSNSDQTSVRANTERQFPTREGDHISVATFYDDAPEDGGKMVVALSVDERNDRFSAQACLTPSEALALAEALVEGAHHAS